ncbi:MAG TPA: hypothetical protein VJN48_11425 [Terriglobales bacterium]|nr:hypothetical protein [Terriglobales bacterium]
MKNALRIVLLLLSVVALYGSSVVPAAMADGNPYPCPPGSRACK